MDNIREFIQNHKKVAFSIIIIFVILFISIPVIIFLNHSNTKDTSEYNGNDVDYYVDDISGKEFGNIDQEPEESVKNDFTVIGLDILIDMGYTSQQYDIIYNTIVNYFKNTDTHQVNYLKNSFKYAPDNTLIAYFTVVEPNSGEEFIIKLDNQARKLFTISASISNP